MLFLYELEKLFDQHLSDILRQIDDARKQKKFTTFFELWSKVLYAGVKTHHLIQKQPLNDAPEQALVWLDRIFAHDVKQLATLIQSVQEAIPTPEEASQTDEKKN